MKKEEKKDKKIKKTVRRVDRSEISSIKQVVSGILKVIDDPESKAKDLKDVIELDPPLTGKVLRVANSAYYSIQRKVGEIEQAAILIGFDAIRELALSLKVCEIFASKDTVGDYSRIDLWKHSIAVGLLGRMIFRREFRERGQNIYIAGLLHEIGIIAIDQFLHNDFKRIIKKSDIEKKNLTQTEYEILGYHHAELGMAITDHWNLPREIVMCIGYHHHPTDVPREFSRIVSTLYIADYLCQEKAKGYGDSRHDDQTVFQECIEILGLKPYSLDLILEDFEEEFPKLENQGVFMS